MQKWQCKGGERINGDEPWDKRILKGFSAKE
jgi:hypothetical protein